MIKNIFLFKIMFVSFVRCYHNLPPRILTSGIVRSMSKRKTISDSDPVPVVAPGWVTINLGNADEKSREMESRINRAERWVSKKLTDEESDILNRSLGIEEEILESIGEGKAKSSKDSGNKLKSLLSKKSKQVTEEMKSAAKVRGFLELNPYLCSGCGTPFQSKTPDSPGYLQKEKLQDHRAQAAIIRDKQEAIRILDMAGIDVTSPAAEKILRDANIAPDVIAGVRALGHSDFSESSRRNVGRGLQNSINDDHTTIEDEDDEEDDSDEEIEEDPLDGLEIDLADLLKTMGPGGSGSVKNSLLQVISDTAATSTQQITTKKDSANEELNLDDADLTNAIELELNRKKRSIPSMKTDKKALKSAGEAIPNLMGIPLSPTSSASTTSPLSEPGLPDAICVCQRCFRLQQYGRVEETLRPGWSSHELLTPERFEKLLNVIQDTDAVVLCIVDIFDLQGSLLPNLKSIAGKNPIVVAANKLDLLPKDVSQPRVLQWIHEAVKSLCGLRSPRDAEFDQQRLLKERGWTRAGDKESGVLPRQNVHLVSCQSGAGMQSLLSSLTALAADHGQKVYVMGAANVGKSSFINRLLETERGGNKQKRSSTPQATVSNLPGTTLDFIKIRLPNGISVIDTPGLINKGVLTSRVNFAELKQIIPVKPINAVSLRVTEGKCVLIGGLGRIELTEGRPVFFTFYVSNEIKLHPTDSSRADEFVSKHVGTLVTPPATFERVQELGPFESHSFLIEGDSWKKAAKDVVIAGLGWVAVTGPGLCRVTVTVPQGTNVALRESLMPFDAMHTTASFTGGRLSKKSSRPGAKGYGWRA